MIIVVSGHVVIFGYRFCHTPHPTQIDPDRLSVFQYDPYR